MGYWQRAGLSAVERDPDHLARFAGNPDGTVDVRSRNWCYSIHGHLLWSPQRDASRKGLEREYELGHALRALVFDEEAA